MSTTFPTNTPPAIPAPPIRERIVSRPNPEQQLAQEQPRMVTDFERDELARTVEGDMLSLGFMSRHVWEAKQFLQAYVRQTQQWHASYEALQRDEELNGGFSARANEFIEDCRAIGGRVKAPKYMDAQSLEKVYLTALSHSHATTKKLTGGVFALLVAVVLKAYLLLPLAAVLMEPVLGRGESATKFFLATILAVALSYGITFMVRFIMMMIAAISPGEGFKEIRTAGQMLGRKMAIGLLIGMTVALVGTLLAFMQVDMQRLSNTRGLESPVVAAGGLALLFVGTVIAYEFFVTYKILRYQQEPQAIDKARLRNSYLNALKRYNDEVALAQGRTLAIYNQDAWQTFMAQMDAVDPQHAKASVARASALRTLRGVATDFKNMGNRPKSNRAYIK
ncbi:MAG: hypothetical protein KF824_05715 [Fimbriimonadaceae bacterium]|nr:MAG: hypothetical protein KF824_05715 [Fimbriimonadaceae bacterium]